MLPLVQNQDLSPFGQRKGHVPWHLARAPLCYYVLVRWLVRSRPVLGIVVIYLVRAPATKPH